MRTSSVQQIFWKSCEDLMIFSKSSQKIEKLVKNLHIIMPDMYHEILSENHTFFFFVIIVNWSEYSCNCTWSFFLFLLLLCFLPQIETRMSQIKTNTIRLLCHYIFWVNTITPWCLTQVLTQALFVKCIEC